jgi:hypothetical protein
MSLRISDILRMDTIYHPLNVLPDFAHSPYGYNLPSPQCPSLLRIFSAGQAFIRGLANFIIRGTVYSDELKARNQLITEYQQTIHAQEREIAKLKGMEKEWEESLALGKDDDYINERTFGSN